MAPRARFELATLRLTAEVVKNLSALSGVARKKLEAILASLAAPNPAPDNPGITDEPEAARGLRSDWLATEHVLQTYRGLKHSGFAATLCG